MHRGEEHIGLPVKDRFGAVAVMGIEVPDRHFGGGEVFLRGESGRRYLVEITKAHGLGSGGVMAGWAHEGERRRSMQSGSRRREGVPGGVDCGGDSTARVIGDAGKIRSVGIEVARIGEASKVRGGMCEQKRVIRRGRIGWSGPCPFGMCGTEMSGGASDASRLFGSKRGAVIGAPWVMQDQHGIVFVPRLRIGIFFKPFSTRH